jgi:hypothetical protein
VSFSILFLLLVLRTFLLICDCVSAAFQFPRALERLEELKKGGKNKSMQNGKLTRDKKKDDENCAVM